VHAPGIVPGIYFCSFHIPGNFANNRKAVAGARVGHQEARIFRPARIKRLSRNRAILGVQNGFVGKTHRRCDGFNIQMGDMQRSRAGIL
jgi:hypothetical protein